MSEIAPGRFQYIPTGTALGTLYVMGDYSLKATCKMKGRKNCACWVTLRAPLNTTEGLDALGRELREWFAHGASDAPEAHRERSVAWRKVKCMRVKS